MKQLLNRRLTAWQAVILSLVSTCGILFIILVKYGVCFETNDDRIISEIFSGMITGTPDAHATHVNYLLGKVLSLLFSLTCSVQWYGVFLIFCFVMIYTGTMTVVLLNCKRLSEQLCFWVLGCLLIVANIYIFAVIQYTTVAGALAVAGYVWLLADRHSIRKYVLFCLFEFLAILLRQESMLMVQPIGILVVTGFLLMQYMENRQKVKQNVLELVKCILCIIGIAILAYIGNNAIGDCSSQEWQEYKKYTELRIEIVDYYGFPEYEECKEILDKYDITEIEYLGLTKYLILDNKFELQFMEELRDLAKEGYERENPFSVIKILKRLITYPKYDNCYGYEISIPVMYILVCLGIFMSRKFKYFLPVIALCGSKNLVFAYLIYRSRIPHRVINILFFAELLLLAVIGVRLLWDLPENRQAAKMKYILCLMILGGSALYSVKLGGTVAAQKNANTMVYADCMQQLFDYCTETGGGIWMSNEVISYYTGHVLDTRRYQNRSFLVTGGWFSCSPMMIEAAQTYEDEYSENMRCIIFAEVSNQDNSYVLEFFEERYHINPELTDTFTIEELGLSYAVYQLY